MRGFLYLTPIHFVDRLNNYAQAEGILYCKTDYGKQVLAKNTQIST